LTFLEEIYLDIMMLFLGPAMSGFIVQAFGFSSMLYIISFICFCYAPLMFFLRNPPARDEKIVNKRQYLSA
jgi:hypothetical protein